MSGRHHELIKEYEAKQQEDNENGTNTLDDPEYIESYLNQIDELYRDWSDGEKGHLIIDIATSMEDTEFVLNVVEKLREGLVKEFLLKAIQGKGFYIAGMLVNLMQGKVKE